MPVYPVHKNIFKVGVAGTASLPADLNIIKDMETFEVTVDGNVEEWTPLDQEGWMRRLMTGKSLSITLSGKRSYGDTGNDYVAGLALVADETATTLVEWTLPNGDTLTGNAVINVSTFAGGDSTAIDGLEVEILFDGKPTYTAA